MSKENLDISISNNMLVVRSKLSKDNPLKFSKHGNMLIADSGGATKLKKKVEINGIEHSIQIDMKVWIKPEL